MQSDLPHTLYLKADKDGKVQPKVNANDKAFRLQEEANRKARERRAKQGAEPTYTLEEIFSK